MQYRHVFHAGNFADVHKHVTLLWLLQALQKKAKGFLYLDTHAGEGLYDLGGADARQTGEGQTGIARVEHAASEAGLHPAIGGYLQALARIRSAAGLQQGLYPGSPLLAAANLRDVDTAICVESQASVARALQRTFDRCAPWLPVSPRVLTGDAWNAIRSQLPPPSRRGLVLIDPPYESGDEELRIAAALAEGLARFETGVFALWYPIKKQHDADLWLARITRGIERPTLAAELCVHAPDNPAGLNGSGMLVVNPPWQFADEAGHWQPQLHALLGGASGSRVKWLVHE